MAIVHNVDFTLTLFAMKSLLGGAALALSLFATQASAADTCSLILPGQLEAILGSAITSRSELKGALSVTCSYKLAAGPVGGPGYFFLERYTIPIPAGREQSLAMRTPNSKFIDVPGIGDKATIVDDTHEIVVRKGTTVYHFATRAVPCEKTYPASEDDEIRCDKARIGMLQSVAKLLVML